MCPEMACGPVQDPASHPATAGTHQEQVKKTNGGICNVLKLKTMVQWLEFEDPDLVLRLELGQGKGQG